MDETDVMETVWNIDLDKSFNLNSLMEKKLFVIVPNAPNKLERL
jgi:hypothetical protein